MTTSYRAVAFADPSDSGSEHPFSGLHTAIAVAVERQPARDTAHMSMCYPLSFRGFPAKNIHGVLIFRRRRALPPPFARHVAPRFRTTRETCSKWSSPRGLLIRIPGSHRKSASSGNRAQPGKVRPMECPVMPSSLSGGEQMPSNNALERTVVNRGRAILAMNCVLGGAQQRSVAGRSTGL